MVIIIKVEEEIEMKIKEEEEIEMKIKEEVEIEMKIKEEAEIEMKNTMVKDLQSKINPEDLKKTMILGILKVNINLKIRIQPVVGEAEEEMTKEAEEVEEMTKEVEEAEVEVDLNKLLEKDNIATISQGIQKMKVKRIVSILLNLQISMLMLMITPIMKKNKAKIAEALEDEEEIKIVKEVENVEAKVKARVKAKVAAVEAVEAEVAREVAVAQEEEEIQQEIHIIKETQQLKRQATDYVNWW